MEQIRQYIDDATKQCFDRTVAHQVSVPEPQFGDFASNAALILAKQEGQNPREVAEKIVESLNAEKKITHADVAGPGFINLKVADSLLADIATSGFLEPYSDITIVAETNNPNPFKAMHVGHAFNAILADSIANLLEAGKARVHRVSYHGDVGAHVGKSMYSLLNYVGKDPKKLTDIPKTERNTFMSKMYAAGAKAYKEDEQAKTKINELAEQSFILDDLVYKQVYETVKNWSFQQIDELAAQLGNKPTTKRYLESEADPLGVATVEAHKGSVFQKSDGALIFPGSEYGSFDNVFVSSNGRGLYGARDIGLIQLKQNDFHPDKSYIVTAEEQRDYFKGVIKAAELCLPEIKDVTVNISHGIVKLSTGKMSSRSGDVLEVAWLFEQIADALEHKGSEPNQAVIMGAIRYQFLKVRVGGDVVFDVDEAISVYGNSGPYLQYAYARAFSILSKAGSYTKTELSELEQAEHHLLLKISEFNVAANRAIDELLPHYIAHYLYELTQTFNSFYEKNRVIGHDREALRITLVQLYLHNLQRGLQLLGIPVLEKM